MLAIFILIFFLAKTEHSQSLCCPWTHLSLHRGRSQSGHSTWSGPSYNTWSWSVVSMGAILWHMVDGVFTSLRQERQRGGVSWLGPTAEASSLKISWPGAMSLMRVTTLIMYKDGNVLIPGGHNTSPNILLDNNTVWETLTILLMKTLVLVTAEADLSTSRAGPVSLLFTQKTSVHPLYVYWNLCLICSCYSSYRDKCWSSKI